MSNLSQTRRIIELDPLYKLNGKELVLIDTAENDASMKVTVDTLLGYIAKQINAGTIPDDVFSSCNIVEIGIGEELPIASRTEGNLYFRTCSIHESQVNAGIPSNIKVSPNMSLRIIDE